MNDEDYGEAYDRKGLKLEMTRTGATQGTRGCLSTRVAPLCARFLISIRKLNWPWTATYDSSRERALSAVFTSRSVGHPMMRIIRSTLITVTRTRRPSKRKQGILSEEELEGESGIFKKATEQ